MPSKGYLRGIALTNNPKTSMLSILIVRKYTEKKQSDNTLRNCQIASKIGGDDRTRTDYLYNAIVALSQVSYAPVTTYLFSHISKKLSSLFAKNIEFFIKTLEHISLFQDY